MDAVQQLQKANPAFLNPAEATQEKVDMPEEIQRIWSHFKRYVELNDRRIEALKQDISQKENKLNEVYEYIRKARDKQLVQETREKVHQYNNQSKQATETPIDRNGVAPSQVQLHKIFYTGRGR